MDSNLRYHLSSTLSQQPLRCIVISHCPPTLLTRSLPRPTERNPHARCSTLPKTTAPTVELTKEKATIKIKMDDKRRKLSARGWTRTRWSTAQVAQTTRSTTMTRTSSRAVSLTHTFCR